jgi:hypothetical protein
MNLPSVTWTVLVVLYALFTSWYTSCAGPLTPEEIEAQLGAMKARGADDARIAQVREFLESDTGDDFVMVNVIELREPPAQIEGVAPGDTASDVLDKYMEYMYPALFSRACHPVFFGQATAAALDVWGIEGAERWTTAAGMRYRSRRDMLEIASNPDFQGPHEFKLAAMNKTIAFPVDPWFHLGDPRLVLALLGLVIGLLIHGFEGHRRARRRTATPTD